MSESFYIELEFENAEMLRVLRDGKYYDEGEVDIGEWTDFTTYPPGGFLEMLCQSDDWAGALITLQENSDLKIIRSYYVGTER